MSQHLDERVARPPLIRRSMVTGAANNRRHVETAWQANADAIMLDLEDTVPPAEKPAARAALRDAIAHSRRGGSDVLVRVNSGWSLIQEDLDAAIWPGVDTIVMPKCESVEDIQRIDETIGKLEVDRDIEVGQVKLAMTIESVAGLFRARELAAASERIVSVTLGSEDFTRDIGAEPTATGDEVLLPLLQLILIAREAQVTPLFGVIGSLATLRDLDAVRKRAGWARGVGYKGAACSAREHIPIANETFRPNAEAVRKARRAIEAYEESTMRGDGRIEVDGAVIDTPVVLRARHLVSWAAQVEALEARKAEAMARQVSA